MVVSSYEQVREWSTEGGIRRVSRHGGARGGNGGEEYVFLPGTVLGVESGVWFWSE